MAQSQCPTSAIRRFWQSVKDSFWLHRKRWLLGAGAAALLLLIILLATLIPASKRRSSGPAPPAFLQAPSIAATGAGFFDVAVQLDQPAIVSYMLFQSSDLLQQVAGTGSTLLDLIQAKGVSGAAVVDASAPAASLQPPAPQPGLQQLSAACGWTPVLHGSQNQRVTLASVASAQSAACTATDGEHGAGAGAQALGVSFRTGAGRVRPLQGRSRQSGCYLCGAPASPSRAPCTRTPHTRGRAWPAGAAPAAVQRRCARCPRIVEGTAYTILMVASTPSGDRVGEVQVLNSVAQAQVRRVVVRFVLLVLCVVVGVVVVVFGLWGKEANKTQGATLPQLCFLLLLLLLLLLWHQGSLGCPGCCVCARYRVAQEHSRFNLNISTMLGLAGCRR